MFLFRILGFKNTIFTIGYNDKLQFFLEKVTFFTGRVKRLHSFLLSLAQHENGMVKLYFWKYSSLVTKNIYL